MGEKLVTKLLKPSVFTALGLITWSIGYVKLFPVPPVMMQIGAGLVFVGSAYYLGQLTGLVRAR